MTISNAKPGAEPSPDRNPDVLKPDSPMPTGSGVLGSRPQPSGGSTGMDLEAAERRRLQRTIKRKS